MRRVNPPKTTIPNTLAALPNNQYATALELTSGKLDFDLEPLALSEAFTVASVLISFLKRDVLDAAVAALIFSVAPNDVLVVSDRELSRVVQNFFDCT